MKNDMEFWMKLIKEVAVESRKPEANIKALNCCLNATGKHLAYERFNRSVKGIVKNKKTVKNTNGSK